MALLDGGFIMQRSCLDSSPKPILKSKAVSFASLFVRDLVLNAEFNRACLVLHDLSAPKFPKPRVRELPVNGYCMNLIEITQNWRYGPNDELSSGVHGSLL